MADLENLTDSQLRNKLLEHGFPIMPITGTTRKIMIKKLKLLLENKKKSQINERRTLAKFSSDDDSESEVKPTQNRRATVATARVAVSPARTRFQLNGNAATNGNILTNQFANNNKQQKPSLEAQYLHDNSDSDVDPTADEIDEGLNLHVDNKDDNSNSLEVSLHGSLGKTISDASQNSIDTPPKQFTAFPRHSSSIKRPEPLSSAFRPAHRAAEGVQASSTPIFQNNRLSNLQSSTYGYLAHDADVLSEPLSDEELQSATPYLSNFSKRLSQLTKHVERPDNRGFKTAKYENKGEGFYSRSKQKLMKYFVRSKTTRMTVTHPKGASTSKDKGNFVSVVLVGGVASFFICLLALYYGMHRGSNTNDIVGLSVPYCTATLTTNCLSKEDAQGGVDLYKILKPKLIELAINYHCGDVIGYVENGRVIRGRTAPTKFYMTDEDIVTFVRDNYKVYNESEILKDINSFVLIAYRNRFLGVDILEVDTTKTHGENYKVIENFQALKRELGFSGMHKVKAFTVLSPTLPWECSFWMKFNVVGKGLLTVLIIATVLFFARAAYRAICHRQQQRKQEVVSLVEKIVEVLQTQADENQFQVINHVRDMIIPINSRKKMEHSWKKAIAFIDENESRIRTEVQTVKGESFEVWRWIGGQNSMNASANNIWQGQAFDVNPGGVNTPPCSPTPCLKIRGMIDENDRHCNKAAIKDALLSKCGQLCRVLHVSVDTNSKCVYMKCADTMDAAVAFRNLHSQWFAGHLVTVKYLRLERYMQRFPDSPQQGPPFLKALN